MMPYFMDNAKPSVSKMGPRLAFEDGGQKACRARARKFSLENTRRRKSDLQDCDHVPFPLEAERLAAPLQAGLQANTAQEERRKAEEIREQKLQEEILQQRRKKLQEATEQHQRAHLPPSQRNRPVTRRPAHVLGNALRRIEGTFSLCALQYPFYSGSPSTYRRCHSSANSSVASSKPGQQRQLSAAVAYVKLLQEKSANNLPNRDLFFHKLREKQHPLEERRANSNQENSDVGQLDQTENLSSLETENYHYSHTTDPSHTIDPSSGHSYTLGPSHMPSPSRTAAVRCASSSWLEHCKGLRIASEAATESVGLDLSERQNEASLSSQPADSQRTEESGVSEEQGPKGPPAWGVHGGEEHESRPRTEPTPASAPPSTLSDQNTPTADHQTNNCKPNRQSALSITVPLAVPCGAWGGPDATPTECSSLTGREKTAESIQQTGNETDHCSSRAMVSYITSPTRRTSSGKGSGNGSKTPAASFSTEPWHTNCISSLPIDVNSTLNKNKERECPENSDPSNKINQGDHTEEAISNSSVTPVGETHKHPSTDLACNPVSSTGDIKSIKGILKKQSKYVSGLSIPCQTSGSFNITKQTAHSIRDSVELAKHDSKEPESVKKKLRWLDEERLNVAKEGPGAIKGKKDTPSQLQRKSAELQKHPLCAGRPSVVQVAAGIASTGYRFAKQAWSDSGGEREGPLQDHSRGKGSPRRRGPSTPRTPRRAGSAPAGPRSLPCRSRKSTGVRPQTATGGCLVDGGGRTQGRTLLPRPPRRTDESEGDVEGSTLSDKAPDSCATPERRTAMAVGGLTFTPFPPACSAPPSTLHNVNKGICISNQRYSLGKTDGGINPCPNSASTGQEVYQLWNGIQSTLVPKGSNSSFHSWVST